MTPLAGKVVLVTGAGVRVGRALAEGMAAAGAQVAIHYNSSEQGAREVMNDIAARGGQARVFQADLSQSSQVRALCRAVESEFGRVDILVNSASLFERQAFLDTDEDVLDRQWALNARAPFLLSQEVGRRMVARSGGDIINIVDIGGVFMSWPNYAAYCMTKAALAELTRCLALELAPKVRVNAVAPGTVLPPAGSEAADIERWTQQVPMQRLGTPQDVVDTVLFFLTGPRFVTGEILSVDGGRRLKTSGR